MLLGMSERSIVHEPTTGQGSIAEVIMRALPAWFGIESAIVEYVQAVNQMPTLIATIGTTPVGFMTVDRHFPEAAELHVLGVLQTHHQMGIGRQLLDATEAYLRCDGCVWLQVKTLSAERSCEAYAKSRAWYTAIGFSPLQVFPLLWDEANPALQLIKRLT
jgi:ribosomal protein S18 acetylase RimI-like enzyme